MLKKCYAKRKDYSNAEHARAQVPFRTCHVNEMMQCGTMCTLAVSFTNQHWSMSTILKACDVIQSIRRQGADNKECGHVHQL